MSALSYHDSKEFRNKRFLTRVNNEPLPVLPACASYEPWAGNGPALRTIKTYVMERGEEKHRFLTFNWFRKQQVTNQRNGQTRVANRFLKRAKHLEEYLTRLNMPLVYSQVCRNRARYELDWDEAISEGQMAIRRAVLGYNVIHGVKFSTYAVRIILNCLSSFSQKRKKAKSRLCFTDLTDINADAKNATVVESDTSELIEQLTFCLENNQAELSTTEQKVLEHRFGLYDKERLTLEAIGDRIGVSKERVRQIETKALSKIRAVFLPAV